MNSGQFQYPGKTPESAWDHGRIIPHKNIIIQQSQQKTRYQPHVATAQHLDHARTDKQVHPNGNSLDWIWDNSGQYHKKTPESSMDHGRSGSKLNGPQKIFAQFQNQGSHSKNVRPRELRDRDEQDFSDLDEQDHDEEEQTSADWRSNGRRQPEQPSDYGRPNNQSHYHTNGSQEHNRLQSAMAVRGEVTENYQTGNPFYPAKSKEQPGDFGRHFRY